MKVLKVIKNESTVFEFITLCEWPDCTVFRQ